MFNELNTEISAQNKAEIKEALRAKGINPFSPNSIANWMERVVAGEELTSIPIILGGVGVLLSALWVLAISDISSGKEIAVAIFTAVTQGILIAGASVYSNQLIKQLEKKGD